MQRLIGFKFGVAARTLRIDTRYLHASKTPVETLAVILQEKLKSFPHFTQWLPTSSLQENKERLIEVLKVTKKR